MKYRLLHGDCLKLLKEIPDNSVDMVLADPPYGTTDNVWDKKLDMQAIWQELRRICKGGAAKVMFSQLPFSVDVIQANRKEFRYEWIWQKSCACGFLNAKKMPLRMHENILVFYDRLPTYNPQFTYGKPITAKKKGGPSENYGKQELERLYYNPTGRRYPVDIVKFHNNITLTKTGKQKFHPTQKPVDLLSYLIKTYTNEGAVVLDFTMGGGSTGIACMETGRNFIGMELDDNYFSIAKRRIEEAYAKTTYREM